MIWIALLLSQSPARAEAPHIPAEMQQKVEDISAALRESYREAQTKMRSAKTGQGVAPAVLEELGKIWAGAKAKGHSAIIYLDHQLHEHVIGVEQAPSSK